MRFFLAFVLLASLVVSMMYVTNLVDVYQKGDIGYDRGHLTAALISAVTTPKAPDRLTFVGDILLARDVEDGLEEYGAAYPYQSVVSLLASSSDVIGNFESAIPMTHEKTPSLTTRFSVDPQYLSALHDAGFSYVSLANNHTLDYGSEGYDNAKTQLSERGIRTFGHPARVDADYETVAWGDQTVALIGLHFVYNSFSDAELIGAIEYAALQSDLQIVYVHWGDEYELVHNAEQERLAKLFIDAGADMVIGHHPHVVQDVGVYKNKLILYSLGNFIFDQYFSEDVQRGLLLQLSAGEYPALSLVPVTSIDSWHQPRVMPQRQRDTFLAALAKRSDEGVQTAIKSGEIKLTDALAISPQMP